MDFGGNGKPFESFVTAFLAHTILYIDSAKTCLMMSVLIHYYELGEPPDCKNIEGELISYNVKVHH